MSRSKNWTRRAAIGSLVSGAGFLVFGTGGSTQISSYRDVAVNRGTGDDAVLQFTDMSSEKVVDSSNSPAVYKIDDTNSVFSESDILVTATAGSVSVPVEVIKSGDSFKIKTNCPTGESGLSGYYDVTFDFKLSNASYILTATRTTESKVKFECYDFGNSNNYRDSGKGGNAAQPDKPKGTLETPGNVNVADAYAKAIAVCNSGSDENPGRGNNSGSKGGRVGYALPSTQQNGEYELYVKYKNSNGNWQIYLTNREGNKRTEKYNLNGGSQKERSETIEFTDEDNTFIKNNADDLYLIFETRSSGNCASVDIDYFELRKAETSSN